MRGCLVVQRMCGGWPADHTRSQTRSTYTTQLLRYRNFPKVVNFIVVLCTLRHFSRLYYYLGNLAFLFVSVRPFSPYFLVFPDFRFSPLYHLRSTVHPLCATFFHSVSLHEVTWVQRVGVTLVCVLLLSKAQSVVILLFAPRTFPNSKIAGFLKFSFLNK